jgi:hypothetical protein
LAIPLPFPFGGGVLESLLPRLGGGERERDGLVEYFLRLGAGDGDREADFEGLRPLRFGGGERDTEWDGLRPRRFGAGERERLYETLRFDLILRGGERERERDAVLNDSLRPRPRALLRAGEGLRVYERPRELDLDRDLESRLRRTGDRERE